MCRELQAIFVVLGTKFMLHCLLFSHHQTMCIVVDLFINVCSLQMFNA